VQVTASDGVAGARRQASSGRCARIEAAALVAGNTERALAKREITIMATRRA